MSKSFVFWLTALVIAFTVFDVARAFETGLTAPRLVALALNAVSIYYIVVIIKRIRRE